MSSDVCFSEKTRRGVRVYGISRELRRIMQIWKGQPAFPIRPGVLKSPIKITRLFLVSSSFPKKKIRKKFVIVFGEASREKSWLPVSKFSP